MSKVNPALSKRYHLVNDVQLARLKVDGLLHGPVCFMFVVLTCGICWPGLIGVVVKLTTLPSGLKQSTEVQAGIIHIAFGFSRAPASAVRRLLVSRYLSHVEVSLVSVLFVSCTCDVQESIDLVPMFDNQIKEISLSESLRVLSVVIVFRN